METLVCKKANKSLVKFILEELGEVSYATVQKLLRKKDIKLNGKRIKADTEVNVGDVVEIFGLTKNEREIPVLYQDKFLVVVNKPANIEVVTESGECLQSKVSKQIGQQCFAVHRIDRNTTGLVVFALDQQTKEQLDESFKKHTIKKYYLAIVVGVPSKKSERLVAYHKKDAKAAICYISDTEKPGYSQIITKYTLLKTNDILSLLEVEIETGKTHQIRAHLAHIGLPLLGDEKYGDKQANKQAKTKKQQLVAYKLKFSVRTNYKHNLALEQIELPNVKNEFLSTI